MTSDFVVGMELVADNAILKWRKLIGPTNSLVPLNQISLVKLTLFRRPKRRLPTQSAENSASTPLRPLSTALTLLKPLRESSDFSLGHIRPSQAQLSSIIALVVWSSLMLLSKESLEPLSTKFWLKDLKFRPCRYFTWIDLPQRSFWRSTKGWSLSSPSMLRLILRELVLLWKFVKKTA